MAARRQVVMHVSALLKALCHMVALALQVVSVVAPRGGRTPGNETERSIAMTNLFRWPGGWWDPFGTLRQMRRELERVVGADSYGGRLVGGGSFPPVNVYSGPDDVIVQCEVPGVASGDLDLSITGETLVIKGAKRQTQQPDKVRYERRERGFGEFSRTIVLPDPVEADRVEAKLDAGVLTVRLPKSQAAKPKQIEIK